MYISGDSGDSDKRARVVSRADDETHDRVHARRAKKAQRLVRVWPLLKDGQDPDELKARVAFHLHRTGSIGKRLAATSFLTRPHLQALSQGRFPIGAGEVATLAQLLGIQPRELLRPLSEDETATWAFYRTSARHREHVWRRAQACWTLAGISARLAAAIMHMRYQNLAQATDSRASRRILSREPAMRLAMALNLRDGPETFLMFAGELWPPEHKLGDVVPPLTKEQVQALKDQHSSADSRR